MWEDILKGRGLNFKLLKRLTLIKGREMKGKVLTQEEYLQLQEVIRQVYSAENSIRQTIPLDRISKLITKILKGNGLLEVKRKRVIKFDADGKQLGVRLQSVYHFI
tara:strand:- start:363 stop:680 length:318 start_codon:yes stop_codon:yes gene_type:complete